MYTHCGATHEHQQKKVKHSVPTDSFVGFFKNANDSNAHTCILQHENHKNPEGTECDPVTQHPLIKHICVFFLETNAFTLQGSGLENLWVPIATRPRGREQQKFLTSLTCLALNRKLVWCIFVCISVVFLVSLGFFRWPPRRGFV